MAIIQIYVWIVLKEWSNIWIKKNKKNIIRFIFLLIVFYYVTKLLAASKESFNESVMFELMNKYSIQTMFKYHENDDEMKGIRELTDNYNIVGMTNTHLKVILKELQTFEKDLFVHARIENEVLFPKALDLESKVAKVVAESLKAY